LIARLVESFDCSDGQACNIVRDDAIRAGDLTLEMTALPAALFNSPNYFFLASYFTA